MICQNKYRYRLELTTGTDVARFRETVERCGKPVSLVCPGYRTIPGTMLTGATLRHIPWDDLYMETDYDSYRDFAAFMAQSRQQHLLFRKNMI